MDCKIEQTWILRKRISVRLLDRTRDTPGDTILDVHSRLKSSRTRANLENNNRDSDSSFVDSRKQRVLEFQKASRSMDSAAKPIFSRRRSERDRGDERSRNREAVRHSTTEKCSLKRTFCWRAPFVLAATPGTTSPCTAIESIKAHLYSVNCDKTTIKLKLAPCPLPWPSTKSVSMSLLPTRIEGKLILVSDRSN